MLRILQPNLPQLSLRRTSGYRAWGRAIYALNIPKIGPAAELLGPMAQNLAVGW